MPIGKMKSALIQGIARSGLKWPMAGGGGPAVTTILFHDFFGREESKDKGRERLKRFCEWMRANYQPINAAEYAESLRTGKFKPNALFVTFDDARSKLLDGIDIFTDYGIPVTIFAACGWLGAPRTSDRSATLARTIAVMEHYKGEPQTISLPNGEKLTIGAAARAAEIDRALQLTGQYPDIGMDLWSQLNAATRNAHTGHAVCSWSELDSIVNDDISVASHSMSHCRMAGKSALRLGFEIGESRKLLEERFGKCDMFAYPYGSWDVVNEQTTQAVKSSGYECGFLVAAGYGRGDNKYNLPRTDIPDDEIQDSLFRALVGGGQIPLIMFKNLLTGRNVLAG